MNMNVLNGQLKGHGVPIGNTSLVIIVVYLPMLFNRLGYLSDDRHNFKPKECQVKVILVSQCFMTDEEEILESKLFLDKVLTDYDNSPELLPRSYGLTENELEIMEQLKKAVLMNWDKMGHTGWGGFQKTLIQRKEMLKMEEDNWMLTVEEKSLDILLDSLPRNLKLVKAPWMEKMFRVKRW